jgi:hypothetical protein
VLAHFPGVGAAAAAAAGGGFAMMRPAGGGGVPGGCVGSETVLLARGSGVDYAGVAGAGSLRCSFALGVYVCCTQGNV